MIKYKIRNFFLLIIILSVILNLSSFMSLAASEKKRVNGKVYEFDDNSHYELQENKATKNTKEENTYGSFTIKANISNESEKNKIPSYEIVNNDLEFYYTYNDSMLNGDVDEWNVIEDKSKNVSDIELESKILNGAIILQTSNDQKNWTTVKTFTNAFADVPNRTESIYKATDVELINGCFYRAIVAYRMKIRIKDSKFLFINTDKYDYKKCVEVYELYAYSKDATQEKYDSNKTYNLGKRVRVSDFDTYSGEKSIDAKDPHKDWDLGNFFVSGYTEDTTDAEGNMVFLKNAGDKVILWFKLNENIDKLRGNKNLSITADTNGYDQYFEKGPMDFGRGVLFVRYTDRNNNQTNVITYTNFLEANACIGADTKVRLFEEGDYEVALDYEITNTKGINRIGHYRIFFKFSVRNGNSMVFFFDSKTNAEILNNTTTENGFYIDFANSKYLDVDVKREILNTETGELDMRFNRPTKSGEHFTEEGVYTITFKNKYIEPESKKIYVGNNDVLKAFVYNPHLTLDEVKYRISQGDTIDENGKFIATSNTKTTSMTVPNDNVQEDGSSFNYTIYIILPVAVLLALVILFVYRIKKNKQAIELPLYKDENGGPEE